MQLGGTLDDASSEPTPAVGGRWATAAHVALCAAAVALPSDEAIVTALGADRSAFAPALFAGFAATALFVPVLLRTRWWGVHLTPVLLLAGAMIAGTCTLFLSVAIGEAHLLPEQLPYHPFKFAVLGILFATAARDPRWRRRLRQSYLAGWALFVGYAAWKVNTSTAEFVRHSGGIVRVSVAGLNENQQSMMVGSGIVMCLAGLLGERRPLRLAAWSAALLAGFGVFVLGVSRGATIGLLAGLAFVLASFAWTGRLRRGPLIALASALAVGGLFAGARVLEATSMLGGRFQATVDRHDLGDRDRLARAVLRLALDHPWSGVGFGRTAEFLASDPHNSYLKIVAEGGAPAALLLAAALVAIAVALTRVGRVRSDLGPAGALVVLLVAALVGQAMMRPPFWYFLAMTSAAALARPDRREEAPT